MTIMFAVIDRMSREVRWTGVCPRDELAAQAGGASGLASLEIPAACVVGGVVDADALSAFAQSMSLED